MISNIEEIYKNSIWKPTAVVNEPKTCLTQWQVYKVRNPSTSDWDIHFFGYAGYEGRVCSAVQSFDKDTRCGVTLSGRIYELCMDPGFNKDALYVWNKWLRIYGNPEAINITDEYELVV